MTEQEWLVSEDPVAMLRWARAYVDVHSDYRRNVKISDRKLRLFACVCYKDLFNPDSDLASTFTHVISVVEKWSDGEITRREALDIDCPGDGINVTPEDRSRWYLFQESALEAVNLVLNAHTYSSKAAQASLLREIVGNSWKPWRLVYSKQNADEARARGDNWFWAGYRTPQALDLVQYLYNCRDWSGLPALADMLEEAGCQDEAILLHLRGQERCWKCGGSGVSATYVDATMSLRSHCVECESTGWMPLPGPHVRGCWALDLILGKE